MDKHTNHKQDYEERETQKYCEHEWIATTAGTHCSKCGKKQPKNEIQITC